MLVKIREARKAAGIKQGDFAKMIGVSSGAVSQWEKGRTKPGVEKLKKIADVLGITVDELLSGELKVG